MDKKTLMSLVKIDDNGCWIWQRSLRSGGYAQCSVKDHPKRLGHHMVYIVYKGEIPANKILMHTCDVPACVNPKHLKPGTMRENTQDMVEKKRYNHKDRAVYNTAPAREALAAKYRDPIWRAEQGRKIAEGFKRRKQNAD